MKRVRPSRIIVVLSLLLALAHWAIAVPAEAQADDRHLAPPTATRFADPAWYDVVDATQVEDGHAMRLLIELGAIDASGGLPLGITQPIVELYLDTGPGGATDLLPGSGMRMPDGDGWNVAVRITGDGAWGWLADEEGQVDLARPVAIEATASGRTIDLRTPFAAAPGAKLYAITGVYDPFRPDGWRPTARTPSPWAFSSPDAGLPVVDVFPADPAATARAVSQGVLPRRATVGVDVGVTLWVALMLAGLAVAVVGLWWRRRTPAPAPVAQQAEPTPRYTALEHPARLDPVVDPDPLARALRTGEGRVDGDLLIGEGDFDALLARLDETLGTPPGIGAADADGVGERAGAAVADQRALARSGEAALHDATAGGATADDDAPVWAAAGARQLALPAPDAFTAFDDATRRDQGEDEEEDERLLPSR